MSLPRNTEQFVERMAFALAGQPDEKKHALVAAARRYADSLYPGAEESDPRIDEFYAAVLRRVAEIEQQMS